MSLIFHDGFDHYTSLLDKYDIAIGTSSGGSVAAPVIQAGAGRGGAGAVFMAQGSNIGTTSVGSMIQKNVGSQTTLFKGFAFKFNPAGQTTDTQIFAVLDVNTVQVALWITSAGTLYFTRGGSSTSFGLAGFPSVTAIGASTGVSLPANSYHYLEVEVIISPTVGVANLRIDQTAVLTQTGLNTRASANSSFTSVVLGAMWFVNGVNCSAFFDDTYDDNAQFNGDLRVNGQVPSGDGSTQNFSPIEAAWAASTVTNLGTTIIDSNGNLQRCTAITGDFKTGTPTHPTWQTTPVGANTTDNHVTWSLIQIGGPSHFNLVNEPDPDGDSSYVQSNTVNQIERFTFPAIPGANVIAVTIWPFARKDDGGFRTIQGAIKSGGTLGTTGTDVALGSNYQYLFCPSLTDPNTAAPWTLPAVNAAEFGVKITN